MTSIYTCMQITMYTIQHLLVLKPSESTTTPPPPPTLLKEHQNQPPRKRNQSSEAPSVHTSGCLRCLKSSTSVARRLPDPNSSSSERKGGDCWSGGEGVATRRVVMGWNGLLELVTTLGIELKGTLFLGGTKRSKQAGHIWVTWLCSSDLPYI